MEGGTWERTPGPPCCGIRMGRAGMRRFEARLEANIIPVAFILQRQTAELDGHLLMT